MYKRNFSHFFKIFLALYVQITALYSALPPFRDPSSVQILFITTLIKQNLNFCKLMIFQDSEDNSELVTHVVRELGLVYYNVKYILPSDSEFHFGQQKNKALSSSSELLPSENLTKVATSAESLPVRFANSITNHQRRSGQCFVVILMINDVRPVFMTQIFRMITPVYIPITKKDEDYYIFITKPKNMNTLLLMNELPARIKYKLAVGLSPDNKDPLVIKTVCFFCDKGSPRIIRFSQDLHMMTNYFPDFVQNLNGKVLRVSVPGIQSRIEVEPPYTGIQNAKRGLWKNLFEDFLGIKFNFTYTMFLSTGADGNYGGGGTGLQLENGTWIGVVGDIYYGKAELGILASKTPKRIYVMDTSDSFFDVTYLTFVTSQGERIFSASALFWPFDTTMWLLIVSSTGLSLVVFKFLIETMNRLGIGENINSSHENEVATRKGKWSLQDQINFIINSLLDQDTGMMPMSGPLRCFVAFWLFFTLVITSVYRSKLVTLMAFPVMQQIPRTFEELAYSDYKVGFMKHGDSAYNTLAASSDPVYKKLIAEMEVVTGVGLDCLEKVVQTQYGCIAYEFSLKYLRERNLSDSDIRKLVFAPDHTYNIWTGLNFEGRSIYKQNFDKWLRLTRPMYFADIWETRDMYQNVRTLKRNWWMETGQMDKAKETNEDAESAALTVKHVLGAFAVFCVGVIIGLISFLGENMYIHGSLMISMLTRTFLKSSAYFFFSKS